MPRRQHHHRQLRGDSSIIIIKGGDLSSSLTHQLSLIYRPLIINEEVDPHLKVYIPPVQQQDGQSDCGAFAIAFALHALLCDKLEMIEFDRSQMK